MGEGVCVRGRVRVRARARRTPSPRSARKRAHPHLTSSLIVRFCMRDIGPQFEFFVVGAFFKTPRPTVPTPTRLSREGAWTGEGEAETVTSAAMPAPRAPPTR